MIKSHPFWIMIRSTCLHIWSFISFRTSASNRSLIPVQRYNLLFFFRHFYPDFFIFVLIFELNFKLWRILGINFPALFSKQCLGGDKQDGVTNRDPILCQPCSIFATAIHDHYRTDKTNNYKETIKELQHQMDSINEIRAKESIYYQGKLQEKNETEVTKYDNKFKIYGICFIGLVFIAIVFWIVRKLLK